MSKREKITIDKSRLNKVRKTLSKLRFSHPPSLAPAKINKESDLFLLYILSGICHQFNWNFLITSLDKVRKENPSKFTPEYLSKVSHQELIDWLFDYPKKKRLEKKFKRAKFVRNLAQILVKKHERKVTNLLKKAKGKIGGKRGVYSLLRETIAYGEDPLFKKASVFVAVAEDLELAKFSDWGKYIPPIDYHIARILLRTGTIKINDKKLLSKLLNYNPVKEKEDILIRKAAIKVVKLMAGKTAKRRKTIQGLLWCLGRDCCHEEVPHCRACNFKKCLCKTYIAFSCDRDCFLKGVCYAFQENKDYLKLREQNFISTWY